MHNHVMQTDNAATFSKTVEIQNCNKFKELINYIQL